MQMHRILKFNLERRALALVALVALVLGVLWVFYPAFVLAERRGGNVQEVNFDEISLKGEVRNPQGSFLVQKRSIKFLPLYDMQKSFDKRIRQSADYLKK